MPSAQSANVRIQYSTKVSLGALQLGLHILELHGLSQERRRSEHNKRIDLGCCFLSDLKNISLWDHFKQLLSAAKTRFLQADKERLLFVTIYKARQTSLMAIAAYMSYSIPVLYTHQRFIAQSDMPHNWQRTQVTASDPHSVMWKFTVTALYRMVLSQHWNFPALIRYHCNTSEGIMCWYLGGYYRWIVHC